jgi:hypothetical protein
MSERERIRRSWDGTSESFCNLGPTFLLCEETGELAGNGTCPEHGGDACLFVYGKVLLLDAERNPAIAALALRVETLETALREIQTFAWESQWEAAQRLKAIDATVERVLAGLSVGPADDKETT